MNIERELMKSLCDHPATGPKLIEYLVTGERTSHDGLDIAYPTEEFTL